MTKRMTTEEKRKVMLQVFHERKTFFQLKELEKIGSREKKIALPTIKDVLQSLVDDGMVHLEKIGTSNYYWAFPSEASVKREKKLEELRKQYSELENQQKNLEKQIEQSSKGKEKSDERDALEQELAELEKQYAHDNEVLEKHKENDPVVLREKAKKTGELRNIANAWTDNVFILQSWCCNKFGISTSDFNKQFGISDDFDSV